MNFGSCCKGIESTYNIRVGRAKKITGPYVGPLGKDMMDAGGKMFAERDGPFIGPGHAAIFEKDGRTMMSMHFYDPTHGGQGTLAIREVIWDDKGWPALR